VPWHSQPWSIRVTLPPLAVLILKPCGSRIVRESEYS
jgi:hypothetical protein